MAARMRTQAGGDEVPVAGVRSDWRAGVWGVVLLVHPASGVSGRGALPAGEASGAENERNDLSDLVEIGAIAPDRLGRDLGRLGVELVEQGGDLPVGVAAGLEHHELVVDDGLGHHAALGLGMADAGGVLDTDRVDESEGMAAGLVVDADDLADDRVRDELAAPELVGATLGEDSGGLELC